MADINPNELPPLDLQELDAELRKEAQYGERPVEAALGSAASAATFGLSDAALTAAGVSPERLREVRDREAEAAMLGTVTGVVGPALLTGGTSAAAQTASAGVKAATAAGRAAEAAAAKVLAPSVGSTAASIAAKGAGGAVEGALAGAGQLVSDVALDRKDLSAESALATVGTGALFGGGFGTALGTMQATIPKAIDKVGRLTKGARTTVSEALDPLTDPVEASLRVSTPTAAERLKLRESLGKNLDYYPTYLKEELGIETFSSPGQLLAKNKQVVAEAGEAIGAISKRLDELTAEGAVPITRTQAYQPLLSRIDDMISKIDPDLEAAVPQLKILNKYRRDVIAKATKDAPFNFAEFNRYREFLQRQKYRGGGALESMEANTANELRNVARDVIDSIAANASKTEPALATALQKANKTYHIGKTAEQFLKKTANTQAGVDSLLTFVGQTTGRVARNTAVVTDLAARTAKVKQAVTKAVDNFFDSTVRPAKQMPTGLASTQVLLASGFASNPETGKMPKNKDAAFENVQQNLRNLQSDPERMVELIARKTARVSNADPGVGAAMQVTLAKAVQFLTDKLPAPAIQAGLFQRPYKPSSMEMAKFERYMQVIERPLTVLDDLDKGTLTREHVEALKAVYPELYAEVQQAAIDRITSGAEVPYNRKVQMSILLDIPADSSLSADSVMQLQQNFQPDQSSPEAGAVNPTVTGLQNIDMAGRAETDVQAVAADEP
jgi:hypothetical protein